MSDDWEIKITVKYCSRASTIEAFEQIVRQMKDRNYGKGAGGNSATQYSISGPISQPLTEIEIDKLRALII